MESCFASKQLQDSLRIHTIKTAKNIHTIMHAYSLNKLAERNKIVRLQLIKAHIGLDGNELADEYAKLGTADTSEHIKTDSTANQIKTGIRHYIYHKWREKWSALKKYRQTKIFYLMPDRSKFRQVKHFSRNKLKLYIQAITGQNNFDYLNSIIVKDYSSLCRFCKEGDETFAQIVEDCPVFNTMRLGILGVRGGLRPAEIAPRRILEFDLVSEVREALEENIIEDLVKNKQT